MFKHAFCKVHLDNTLLNYESRITLLLLTQSTEFE